jgi:uncharacterized protein YbjT (DUF2867 family)
MKLTIFAATGGAGRQLLQQAIAAGHDVTAAARNPGKLARQVRTVTADLAAPTRPRWSPRSPRRRQPQAIRGCPGPGLIPAADR